MSARNNSPWIDAVPDVKRHPRLVGEKQADVVVVGAGIVGVTAAWNLRQRGKKVILIEKNHVASGDTGATTGFLTKVPDTSLLGLRERYGVEFLKKIFEASRGAQLDLFRLIEEHAIDCDFIRCNAYYGSYAAGDLLIKKEWEAIRDVVEDAALVQAHDLSGTPFKEAIRFSHEGKFNVRKYIFALLERMQGPDFHVFEETEVTEIDAGGDGVIVRTDGGRIDADKVVLAAGRPPDCYAELHPLLEPKLTYVVSARYGASPLTEDLCWDTFEPYFYYRKIDEKTVIVGGADVPHVHGAAGQPFETLGTFLREHLSGEFSVSNEWSGSIFHTPDGLPYACAHPHQDGKVLVGMGFGGNGMIFGTLAGQVLAELASGEKSERAPLLAFERTGAQVARVEHKISAVPARLTFKSVAKKGDFAGRHAICVQSGGAKIALFKVGDDYHAINNACTHQGGSLCDGDLHGKVVACPLHGAKFDVASGAVLGLPATRAVRSYKVRLKGDEIEVELPDKPEAAAGPQLSPVEKRLKTWRSLFAFIAFAVVFWSAEFAGQYYWLSAGDLQGSLIRGFALTGATFIGIALSLSSIFKWRPKWSFYWRVRRRFGVTGFAFIALHVLSVLKFFFNMDPRGAFYSLNPLQNPIIFGVIAFPLFLVMALTSFDWAVERLSPKRWKLLHRVVYVAHWAAIFHFMTINPRLLRNPPGYLLILITGFALFGQLYWYVRIAGKRKFRTPGGLLGIIIILMYLIGIYLVLRYGQVR